ncbi:3-isopropylmalate dehydrogenase [Magnetococcus marinus MC-1]|uniref:3-isopropylmalate dehydrogenase n=1 Tax=Magnetococcus marinus (strain ATCC BAA-1437 / JCM 17883 / MC-1) TaxID=156889 RepID=A0L8J6_MAGMM|nr:3-isopropylmalate dehydrogenase [Magnetococcus marinus]ABK44289.1 3-isopropylmalate dehydrogenase [Magnetococcus marinus MC-1]
MAKKVLVLPGDGIGQEITAEAVKVLNWAIQNGADITLEEGLIGGTAYDATGTPLPAETITQAKAAQAVLLGAVGGTKWEPLDISVRPEKGLLGIRKALDLYCNLRPAAVYPQLADASTLKKEVVAGIDIMVVRELSSGIYFGQPRGVEDLGDGRKKGFNTLVYTTDEIERIARKAFEAARKRSNRVCSVDKANVLESTELWREVVSDLHKREYADVELSHMYVDNAAMQLIRNPRQFDVIVTTNMFGDILSDAASMLTGSIGMLPSASLGDQFALYEPIHGSAPDIAGKGIANPLATILSVAMMLRYSLELPQLADGVEAAVVTVLDQGLRTADIMQPGMTQVGTAQMGDAVLAALNNA